MRILLLAGQSTPHSGGHEHFPTHSTPSQGLHRAAQQDRRLRAGTGMPWEEFSDPRLPTQRPVLPSSHCCGHGRAGQWPGEGHRGRAVSQKPPERGHWPRNPPPMATGPGRAGQSRAVPAPPQQPGMSSAPPGTPSPELALHSQPGGSCAPAGGRSSSAGTVLSPKTSQPGRAAAPGLCPCPAGLGTLILAWLSPRAFISAGNAWKSD